MSYVSGGLEASYPLYSDIGHLLILLGVSRRRLALGNGKWEWNLIPYLPGFIFRLSFYFYFWELFLIYFILFFFEECFHIFIWINFLKIRVIHISFTTCT